MDYKFDEWKKALADFQSNVEKDLEEMRFYKESMQQMRADIISELSAGHYLRDDHRIILSAPEVIIGNVDQGGALMDGEGSRVVLRAGLVGLDGVGEGGRVHTRAASIRQTAVDPGIDGLEAVVGPVSEVVSQASTIVIDSNKTSGAFSQTPYTGGEGSVRIHADGGLLLEATTSSEKHKKNLEASIKALENSKKSQKAAADNYKKAFDNIVKLLQQILDEGEKLTKGDEDTRTNVVDMDGLSQAYDAYAPELFQSYQNCSNALSSLAEINRQLKCLKAEKDAIKSGDDFKKKTTGAYVSVKGENVTITSVDGDGNLRDNDGAGVAVTANNVLVQAIEADRKLKEKGKMTVNVMNFELSTADNADEKYDKGKLKGGTYEAKGDVTIKSKNITMESVDYELKDDKLQEKALTKEGSFKLRAEKMDLSATDTEGKATGSLAMNAKAVSLRSMDVEKEKRTDDKLAAGSTMLLVSEKMYLGAKSKDVKSKKVQAVSEEMGLFADKTLETQQGDGKATLQLAGGKAALGGSETQVYGKTTINAATEVKAELKAPKATIDNVEAKSSFKSPNISDGIAVPGAPSSANLSTKLKTEDAPKE